MKHTLIAVLMLFGTLNTQAQGLTNTSRISLKIQSRLQANFGEFDVITLKGIYPAVVFQTSKGVLHQIEVSDLSLGSIFGNRNIQEANFVNFSMTGAYELLFPIKLFQQRELLTPYLGAGLTSSASSFVFDPNSSNQFYQRGTTFSNTLSILTNLRKDINERLFFDFSLFLPIGHFLLSNVTNNDPSLPIRQQRTSQSNWDFFFFQQYIFRFGFGVRL